MKKLKIGIDIDDVVHDLNLKVIKELEEVFGLQLKYEDTEWGFANIDKKHRDFVTSLYSDPDFMRVTKEDVSEDVFRVIKKLHEEGHDVVFVTAAFPSVSTVRAKDIINLFDFLPSNNYILTSRKDLVALDVLIDDSIKNVENSIADLRVFFDRPWNRKGKGLRVSSFDEFYDLIQDHLKES